MAQPVARVGDTLSHGGQITTGSSKLVANGKPVARVGDQALCAAHGTVTITTGNAKWIDGGKQVARVGSQCSCGATIVSGSPNVLSQN